MSDSFSELRRHGGSNRPWVIGGIAVLVVAALAALAAAGYALTRPADERDPIPRVVTVTAQPGPEPAAGDLPAPGTYTGWLVSDGPAGQSGFRAALAVTPDGAVITYLGDGCTALLSPAGGGQWDPSPAAKSCAATDGTWALREVTGGIVEAELTGGDAHVTGSLSRESRS